MVPALGCPQFHGDGSAQIYLTAEVVDKNGGGLGDVDDFLQTAITRCETALKVFGVVQ